jgi:hypothetical protein
MCLIHIYNIDSLRRVIVDSVLAAQKQQIAQMDFVAKIDSFYNSAWTKLAILFGLIGVIIPLMITYIQSKRNEKEKENLMKELKAELKSEMEIQVKEFKSEIDDFLETELDKMQHASEGVSYQIQSDIYYDKQQYKEAYAESINAMTCYCVGDDYNNFLNAMDDLLKKRIDKVKKNDLEKIVTEYSEYYDINKLIERIEKLNDNKYSAHISKLKEAIFTLQ